MLKTWQLVETDNQFALYMTRSFRVIVSYSVQLPYQPLKFQESYEM